MTKIDEDVSDASDWTSAVALWRTLKSHPFKAGPDLEKIRIQKTNEKKKEDGKPKISGEKNVSIKVFRVLIHFVNRV